jgi:protein-tyrosine-phosphatase
VGVRGCGLEREHPSTPALPHARTLMRILIICHANTSRSIIAEALLKRMLRERRRDDIVVESGGIAPFARDGALVSMDARLVLRDEGIHISPEAVATDLKTNRHLIRNADLILARTREQVDTLRAEFAEAAGKEVLTLKELAGTSGDIDDPAGRDEAYFAARRDEIKDCLTRGLERLLTL